MDAALLTMVAALLAAVLASMVEQRRDGTKTRDKLDENNSALRELTARTTILEASHQHLLQDFGEHRRITENNHSEIVGSLADALERLARMEGYLSIGIPPPDQAAPSH